MAVIANHKSSCHLVQESLIDIIHFAQQLQHHHMDSKIDQLPYYHIVTVQKFYKVDEQLYQFCLHLYIMLICLEDINQSIDLYFLQDTLSQYHIIDQHIVEKSNSIDNDLLVLLVGDEIGVDDDEYVGRQQGVIEGRFIQEPSDVDEKLKCVLVDVRVLLDNRMLDALVDQLADYLCVFVEDSGNEADPHDLQIGFFLRAHILKLVKVEAIDKDAIRDEDQLLVLNNGLLVGPNSDHNIRKCVFLHWIEVQNKKASMIEVFQAVAEDAVVESRIALVLSSENFAAFKDIKQRMFDNSLDFLL